MNWIKENKTAVLAISLFAFFVGFFLYRDQKREEQLTLMLSEALRNTTKDGRSTHDSYLAIVVKNRIIKGYPLLQKCYKNFLTRSPTVTIGNVKMDWQIDTDGSAISPEVVVSPFNDKVFHNCLEGEISKWEFPNPPSRKYVDHTFKFTKK